MDDGISGTAASAEAPSLVALASLPRVPPKERAAMLAGPRTPDHHAAFLARLPGLHAVEVGGRGRTDAPPARLRVAAWNLERGRSVGAATAILRAAGADVALLSELDLGMARSGQRHVARELAAALDMAYAYGVEFLELGLGNAEERARCAGLANEAGYHGAAILSALPLERPALVRLDAGGAWLDGRRGEPRVGGRIAVLATVRVGGGAVALGSVHLESHAGPDERDAQTAALLGALDVYAPGLPALLGGDWNTHGLPRAALEDREALRAALAEDPTRLAQPVRHEPLFARLGAAGFDWRGCNQVETPTERRRGATGSARGSLHLDWLFARGLDAEAPAVVGALDSETGEALSDHELLAVTVAHRSFKARGAPRPPA